MKIRNGFVSNSSSSSFIAIAEKIDADKIAVEVANGSNICFKGGYMCEGVDFFRVDSEFIEYLARMTTTTESNISINP